MASSGLKIPPRSIQRVRVWWDGPGDAGIAVAGVQLPASAVQIDLRVGQLPVVKVDLVAKLLEVGMAGDMRIQADGALSREQIEALRELGVNGEQPAGSPTDDPGSPE